MNIETQQFQFLDLGVINEQYVDVDVDRQWSTYSIIYEGAVKYGER